VAKYEDNTPRNKKVMIQVQVCGRERQRQRRRDYSNTSTLFFQKKSRAKNSTIKLYKVRDFVKQ
jgi:hypothetical protein